MILIERGDIMPYEYLASVQSAVRRINDRLKTLADKFGVNSPILWDSKARIDVLLGDNYRTKNGVPQIIKPSDIFGDEEKMKLLKSLESDIKTWSSYKKKYESQYTRYKEDAEFFGDRYETMTDYIKTMENFTNVLRETDSEQLPSDALEILKMKGQRKSYFELTQVNEILRREGWL